MTEEKNCELLFEYLRSILYDSKIQKLDPESLDEPYQKLGYGLCFLQRAIEEMLAYSADLSQGNLSGFYPSADIFLCVNLKNLHANPNHLTWQAKQVASGDYSQHVSYLGEFSQAFNTMTAKLAAREGKLTDKAYLDPGTGIHNRLFFEERMSLVLEQKKHAVFCYMDLDGLKFVNDNFGHLEGDAYIHHFVSAIQNEFPDEDFFARIGGDEFCLVLLDWEEQQVFIRIRKALDVFIQNNSHSYPASFSFGILNINEETCGCSNNDLLREADILMYENKKENKQKYPRKKEAL